MSDESTELQPLASVARTMARRKLGSAVVVEAVGRPDEDGYLSPIHEYVPTARTDATVLAAWRYGQGRVVASGTWKLFALDQRDNIRLVENTTAWLGKQASTPGGGA